MLDYLCVSQAYVWYFDPVHPKTIAMGALVGKCSSQSSIWNGAVCDSASDKTKLTETLVIAFKQIIINMKQSST